MSLNVNSFGPDRRALQDLVYTFLKDSDRWRDVQAACIAQYVVSDLPVPASHVSEYKAARENSRRLNDLLLTLLSPSQSE